MSGTEAGENRKLIDYEAAAQRLLVALCFFARKYPKRPIPSGHLARPVFGDLALGWQHETRRRRIRDAAVVARQILAGRNADLNHLGDPAAPAQIAADGRGYWFTGDPVTMAWYADHRRKRALQQLAAVRESKPAQAEAAGQTRLLFSPDPHLPKSEFRH